MSVIKCPTRRSIAVYLFKPAGCLRKELLYHLRSKRTIRRSKQAGLNGDGRGQIKDPVSIRQRPAAVEDRAVPGHWEGDLLSGRTTAISRPWAHGLPAT